ncbi:MAG: hypothetical protein IJR28_01780 [Ottowia sp.]|nr:hypothetical protein [Ottowia sp.]
MMKNALQNQVKGVVTKVGWGVLDFFVSLFVWAVVFFMLWLAWKGMVFVAALMPDALLSFCISVAAFSVAIVVLWKIKEILLLLGVLCHVFP